jgi:hypothetical protein
MDEAREKGKVQVHCRIGHKILSVGEHLIPLIPNKYHKLIIQFESVRIN